jgi:CubicO group peptidase (beta-lactamase class C family)
LIDRGVLSRTRAWGDASARTLYQASSFSKLVTAVAALRLVEEGRLDLDRNVNVSRGGVYPKAISRTVIP